MWRSARLTHFTALTCHRARAEVARRASHSLPEAAPRLSAHKALTPAAFVAIGLGLVGLLARVACGSHLESDVLGVVFLAALVFRLSAFAEGLAPD